MNAPVISVVMAAYNGADWIGATVASVLAQDFGDFELIVVDDCSTDDTLARLSAFADPRIRVIPSAENGGPVVARNRGYAVARGDFIVGLDQDDLCHPDRFSTQLAFLADNPQAVLVASAVDMIEGGTTRPHRGMTTTAPALIDWRLQFGNPLVWSSVMIRRAAIDRLAVFERVDRRYAEDFDLYHRLSRLGDLARIDRPLLTYRVHPGGASRRYTQMMEDSAVAVLAEAHAALLGEGAQAACRLALVHFTGGNPVPDLATLAAVNRAVEAIHRHYLASRAPGPAARALIAREWSRLWWQMADASVRSGALTLESVARACPAGLLPHHPSRARAASSALIGRARAMIGACRSLAR